MVRLECEEMRRYVVLAAMLLCAGGSYAKAKDHSKHYMAGVFVDKQVGQVASFRTCSFGQCVTAQFQPVFYYLKTNLGVYRSREPQASWMQGGPGLPFFVSRLKYGDKVIFAAECTKYNVCDLWFPDPNDNGKEIYTLGGFIPNEQENNTQEQILCGKGKLTPDVEAKVCPAPR